MTSSFHPRARRGFLLLEVIVATGLFASVIVGLAVAMDRLISAVEVEQREILLLESLESAAAEAKAIPRPVEGEAVMEPDSNGVVVTRTVRFYKPKNEENTELGNLFLITLTAAHGPEEGRRHTQSCEFIVYRP